METTTLKEVLYWMDGGEPFSLMAITWDEKKKTGGEELFIKQAWKHNPVKPEDRKAIAQAQPKTLLRKNPNHFNNSTRNLRLPNGEIRKVHIRLIRQFNGKTVL